MNFLRPSEKEHFFEHHNWHNEPFVLAEVLSNKFKPITFKHKKDATCVFLEPGNILNTSYYVGVDWLIEKEQAICVQPKLNKNADETDYLMMLFSALKHPEISNHTDDLFHIKWESDEIEIEQHQDLLTPLLVIQFLSIVKQIVRKGLKKSYYKVEQNLYSRVKGKVLVGQTIKQNLLKNKVLNTYCSYDEFGVNGFENRLLKKALLFVQRYLPTIKNINSKEYTTDIFNFIMPAFESVTDEVSLHDVRHTKSNAFFKEYTEAIKLAKLILQRFGYNITNTSKDKIKTPPFWIDMSKLFELYVYSFLKAKYKSEIRFQFSGKGTYLDYLVTKKGEQQIIDAKYKPLYISGYDIADIRQLSGYARDETVLKELGYTDNAIRENTVVPCLIIYPDQATNSNLWENKKAKIQGFTKFEKQAVSLPTLKKQ